MIWLFVFLVFVFCFCYLWIWYLIPNKIRWLKKKYFLVGCRVDGMRMAYGYYPGLGADSKCTESGGFDELRQLCYKLMESIASNRQLWGAQVSLMSPLLNLVVLIYILFVFIFHHGLRIRLTWKKRVKVRFWSINKHTSWHWIWYQA